MKTLLLAVFERSVYTSSSNFPLRLSMRTEPSWVITLLTSWLIKKAAQGIADEHIAQVLGYLRLSRFEHGLLINFGAPRFQIRKLKLQALN